MEIGMYLTRSRWSRHFTTWILRQMPWSHALVLLGLIVFVAGHAYYWLRADVPLPTGSKDTVYMYHMTKYVDLFQQHGLNLGSILRGMRQQVYSPGYILPAAILCYFQPVYWKIVFFSNLPYIILILFLTYKLGTLLVNHRVGLFATILLALFPTFYGPSRLFLIQFAEMGVVLAAVYTLLKCEYFKNRGYSLLFGASMAVCLLVKIESVMFLIGPVGYVAARLVYLFIRRGKEIDFKRASFHIFMGILIVVIATSPVFFQRLGVLHGGLIGMGQEPGESAGLHFGPYLAGLLENQLGPVFFVGFIGAFLHVLFFTAISIHRKWILTLWMALPFGILVSMTHFPYVPYDYPFIPLVALLMAIWINSMKRKRYGVLAFLVLIGLLQHYSFSFGFPPRLDHLKTVLMGRTFAYFKEDDQICRTPRSADRYLAPYHEVFENLAGKIADPHSPKTLLVDGDLSDRHRYNPFMFLFMSRFQLTPYRIDYEYLDVGNYLNLDHYDRLLMFTSQNDRAVRDKSWLFRTLAARVESHDVDRRGYAIDEIKTYLDEKGPDRIGADYERLMSGFDESEILTKNGVTVLMLQRRRYVPKIR